MKTTANSTNSKRRSTTNQSHSSNKPIKVTNKINQITDNETKQNNRNSNNITIGLVHPYIDRVTNKSNSTVNSKPQRRENSLTNISQPQPQSQSQLNQQINKSQKRAIDIRTVKALNQKDFFFSINNESLIKQSELPESKVDLLEKMIVSIKEKAINKYENDYNNKLRLKEAFEKSIEDYKSKINQIRNEKKYQIKIDLASKKQIDIYKNRLTENNYISNDNDAKGIKTEIENFKSEIEKKRKETRELNSSIALETENIQIIQESMKTLNKSISDKKKEKINFYPAITLMQKHIQALQTKIKTQLRSNNELSHKITSLLESNI